MIKLTIESALGLEPECHRIRVFNEYPLRCSFKVLDYNNVSPVDFSDTVQIAEEYKCRYVGVLYVADNLVVNLNSIQSFERVRNLSLNLSGKNNSLILDAKRATNLVELKVITEYFFDYDFCSLKQLKRLIVSSHANADNWQNHEGIVNLYIYKYRGKDLHGLKRMSA